MHSGHDRDPKEIDDLYYRQKKLTFFVLAGAEEREHLKFIYDMLTS